MHFVPNQPVDAILLGEPFNDVLFMLPYPLHQVGSDSCIQSLLSR
jgi:hypothetical protein